MTELVVCLVALEVIVAVPCAVLLVVWGAPTPSRRGVAVFAMVLVPLAPFLLAAVIIDERHAASRSHPGGLKRAVVVEWSIGPGCLRVAWVGVDGARFSTVALAEAEVPAEVAVATVLAAHPNALVVVPVRADADALARRFSAAQIAALTPGWRTAAAEADRLSRAAVMA